MKITRRQLRKLIVEAMFDQRTIGRGKIPQSMINDPEFKQKISDLSADEFEQAADLGDTLDVFPRVVSQSGGYEKAVQLGVKRAIRPYDMDGKEKEFVMNNPKLWPANLIDMGNQIAKSQNSPVEIALDIFDTHFDFETFPGGYRITGWPNGAAGLKDNPGDPEVPAHNISPIFKYMVDIIRDNVKGVEMKLTRNQLNSIIKEAYQKYISEGGSEYIPSVEMSEEEVTGIPAKPVRSGPKLPWFIEEFISDLGVHLDNTEAEKPANIRKFKVEFFGGVGPMRTGYAFTKVRVVFLGTEPQWDGYTTHQMVYSLPYRGYLPSKSTRSQQKIQMSRDLLSEYKAMCEALGIEVLTWQTSQKYRKVPYALDDY